MATEVKSVKKSSVYTKTGDNGTTVLYNMTRLKKTEDYFMAMGDVDELNSFLGLARHHMSEANAPLPEIIPEIQSRLLDLGSHLATPKSTSNETQLARAAFDPTWIAQLETWIDQLDAQLPQLRNFILPSGGGASSTLHVARTIARRAERRVIPLVDKEEATNEALIYLNRLSDFLFVAARYAAQTDNQEEVVYRKPRVKKSPTSTLSTEASA